MASVKAELDRYFELFRRRVPTKVSTFILWLREPSSFLVRVVVACLLILGGVFSFLPIFGLWMLPLARLIRERAPERLASVV
ncbi:hypothetical protein AB7M74_011077 [Bradyrhizobium japonicum]